MKKCPFCAEEIQDAAIKCKHCGSMLGQQAAIQNTQEKQEATQNTVDGLKICPKCSKIYDFSGNKCPDCNVLLDTKSTGIKVTPKLPVFDLPKQTEEEKKKENEAAIGCFSLFVLLIGGCFLNSIGKTPNTVTPQGPSQIDICSAANSFVQSSLKAPSSAKFPYYGDACTAKDLGNKRWQVSSFVDAQNSFGAMLRTHFTVVIEDHGNDDWKLIDIKTSP